MGARRLPDDGWRAYALSLGWLDDDLDYVEWAACRGDTDDDIIAIEPDAIALLGRHGETRSIAPNEIDLEYFAHFDARQRTKAEPDDSLYWHSDEPVCLRPDVTSNRLRALVRPCGRCAGCEKFARMIAMLPSSAPKQLPAAPVDDRLLAVVPVVVKKAKAPTVNPKQLGLLG